MFREKLEILKLFVSQTFSFIDEVQIAMLEQHNRCNVLKQPLREIFTARIWRMMEGNVFSLFTLGGGIPHLHPIIWPLVPCPLLGGTPCPSYNTSTGPMPFLGVSQSLVPGPCWGIPQAQVGQYSRGYPLARTGWGNSPPPSRTEWGRPKQVGYWIKYPQ